jgi:4-amino-4-deoxy-L-arabinose transferase-like glycosyltransferase
LPLLLAGAGAVAGYQAKFMVVPLLAGLAVIATYGIGARLASPAAGLIGAWLLATSPAMLFMTMPVMSDVPVTGLVAASFYLLFGPGLMRAGGAGALIALAVLVRPVLAPLVGVMALWYVIRLVDRDDRTRALRDLGMFAACGLPAAILLGLTNSYLYGSATMTGYGTSDTRFSVEHVAANARNYVQWLAETQTPAALLGILAVFLPIRWLWPEPRARQAVSVAGLAVLVVWALYFVYEVWNAWWYLRFLLPSFPFIFVGVGGVGAALIRGRGRASHAAFVAVVVTWGLFQIWTAVDRRAFAIWRDDRRAISVGQMTRTIAGPDSLIFAAEHTGSVRYYGGRMTGYYFFLKNDWVDRAIDWLKTQEIHPYLLLEEWELAEVRTRFAGQEAVKALDRAPIAIFRDPGTVYLFDLLRGDGEPAVPPTVWTGVDRGVWAAPPSPPPPVMLGRLR